MLMMYDFLPGYEGGNRGSIGQLTTTSPSQSHASRISLFAVKLSTTLWIKRSSRYCAFAFTKKSLTPSMAFTQPNGPSYALKSSAGGFLGSSLSNISSQSQCVLIGRRFGKSCCFTLFPPSAFEKTCFRRRKDRQQDKFVLSTRPPRGIQCTFVHLWACMQ